MCIEQEKAQQGDDDEKENAVGGQLYCCMPFLSNSFNTRRYNTIHLAKHIDCEHDPLISKQNFPQFSKATYMQGWHIYQFQFNRLIKCFIKLIFIDNC